MWLARNGMIWPLMRNSLHHSEGLQRHPLRHEVRFHSLQR
jgi:hypothetical protein